MRTCQDEEVGGVGSVTSHWDTKVPLRKIKNSDFPMGELWEFVCKRRAA